MNNSLSISSKTRRPYRRRLIFVTISVLIIAGLLLAWKLFPSVASPNSSPTTTPSSVLPVAHSTQTKLSPWRLEISDINLDAAIQEVGLTKNGDMGVPSNYTDVGWLKTGPKPGEPGNAVMGGHLNSGINKSAVFENLHKLKPGDIVTVKDHDRQQHFKVTATQSYNVSSAPLEKIFGATQETHLNLITCDGTWDKAKKDYNQRLVVFTEHVTS